MTAVGVVACKFLLVVFVTFGASKTTKTLVAAQEDGGGTSHGNNGVLIGKLNVYHHGVSGSVYAVNETTLLFKDFNYDGQGKDAYFWGGAGGTGPGPNGFIIPDEHGKTNVLRKYANSVFTLTLPDKKKISELKWIAIYDLSRLENFGDVYVPDGFEAPKIIELPALVTKSDVDCGSESIDLIDMKTIRIKRFYLNVYKEEMYFSIGKGHVPSLRPGAGWIIPDELGYLAPLRPYVQEDVTLTLPGEYVFGDEDIHWLAVYDKTNDKSVCYVNIPQMAEAIQPSLVQIYKHEYSLPNCEPLHRDYHLAWDIMGQTITFEVVARTEEETSWLGLGISGNSEVPQMRGSDMAIGWLNLRTGQGIVKDYNADSKAPCTSLLDGKKLGVCPDADLGGSDSYQILEGRRVGPVTVLKFRRQLKKQEEKDKDIDIEKPTGLIWAVGRMMSNGQPGFHELYNKLHLKNITFLKTAKKSGDEGSDDDTSALFTKCLPFVLPSEQQKIVPWQEVQVIDGKLRSFSARLGPSGSVRGTEGRTGVGNPGYAWYIQGYLSPELFLQRGVTYSFKVEGGNNPQAVDLYHPFIITRERLKGPLNEILAGIEITRHGAPKILASGRLCMWSHRPTYDRRLDVSYPTFEKFRNTLKLKCDNSSDFSILEVTPNSSWPDTVYYNSYTQPDMGGLIRIVDNLDSGSKFYRGSAATIISVTTPTATLLLALGLYGCLLTRLVNLAVTF